MTHNPAMATFVVIPLDDEVSQTLAEKIPQEFGNLCHALPRGEWIVAYEGTSRQLFEKIGIKNEIVIVNFSGYWGVASKDLWEWLAVYQK